MPELTTNYRFKKPKSNEYAKPDDFNSNFDSLDTLLKQISDKIPNAVVIDSDLSEASENPVQNKVIAEKLKLCETKHTAKTVTISVSGWLNLVQEVSVTGITSSNTVIISPAPASQEIWGKAGIVCTAQATGKLTFGCKKVPSAAVTANIVILGG